MVITNCVPIHLPIDKIPVWMYYVQICYETIGGKHISPYIGFDRKFYNSKLTPDFHALYYELLKIVLNKFMGQFPILYDITAILYTPKEIISGGQENLYLTLSHEDIPLDLLEKIPKTKLGFSEIVFKFVSRSAFYLSRNPQRDNPHLSLGQLEYQYRGFLDTIINCSALNSELYLLDYQNFVREIDVFQQTDGSWLQLRFYKRIEFMETSVEKPTFLLDPWMSIYYQPIDITNFAQALLEIHGKSFKEFQFMENGMMSKEWIKLNEALTGMYVRDSAKVMHRISGITKVPLKETEFYHIYAGDESIDKHLPAVECEQRINGGVVSLTFPMEFLVTDTRKKNDDSNNCKAPQLSADEYMKKLQEIINCIDLHNRGEDNIFLKTYGIKTGQLLEVQSETLDQPSVEVLKGRLTCDQKQNPRNAITKQLIQPVETFVMKLLYTCEEEQARNVEHALTEMAKNRGLKTVKWEIEQIDKSKMEATMENLRSWMANRNYSKKLIVVISENKDVELEGRFSYLQQKENVPVILIDAVEADQITKDDVQCSAFIEKINVELGGLNYRVSTESMKRWKGTLVIAGDTKHSGRKVYRENGIQEPPPDPSFSAFAHTSLGDPSKNKSKVYLRLHDQEEIPLKYYEDFLTNLFQQKLFDHGQLPYRLIFYKYAEFKSQMSSKEVEIAQKNIKKVVYKFYRAKNLRKPTIVLQTILKHNDFRSFQPTNDGWKSTGPGTVISEPIVVGNKFYIQTNPEDMAKPLLVETVYNDTDISQQDLQQIFYTMVHCNQIRSQISLPYVCVKAYAAIEHAKGLWKEYERQGRPLPLMADRGIYTSRPIDFDAVTRILTETDKE